MCGSQYYCLFGENNKMSCAASAKILSNRRSFSILIVMALISTCVLAQTAAKTSQAPDSKKTSTAKGKKQSAAKSEEKKAASESTGTEKATTAGDGDQEENTGP